MTKISVIITTYNSSETIERALNSVFNQNGVDKVFKLEVIAVDDLSKDDTIEKLNNYPEVIVYQNESNSGGPNKGRNVGLSNATGDYIIIMDHDDEWLADRLMEQLSKINGSTINTCGYQIIDSSADIKEQSVYSKCEREYRSYDRNQTFKDKLSKEKGKQVTYLGGIMFSSVHKKLKFEEEFGQIDFDWILKLFEGNSSTEVCKPLYHRYVDGNNLSLDRDYRIRDYEFTLKTISSYKIKYPDLSTKGIKRSNGTLARYFYLMEEMKQARKYFFKSELNFKTILFILTSFFGYKFVIKNFHFFG